jgi:hypothetical protein
VSRREALGLAVAACVACCIGPILGILGAIAAVGVAASVLIGLAGLIIGSTATVALVVVRRRRRSCVLPAEPALVELVRTRS